MAYDPTQYDLTANPLKQGGGYSEWFIGDLNTRLQNLQQALQSGQIDYATYQKEFQALSPEISRANRVAAIGGKQARAAEVQGLGNVNTMNTLGGVDLNTFSTQYKNLTGKDPTAQEINSFFTNIAPTLKQGGSSSYADVNNIIDKYINTQYGSQVKDFQQGQQENQLAKTQQQTQDLIQQQSDQTLKYLANPDVMSQLEQTYNKNGMLNSGAFSQGLGNTIAQGANQNTSAALGGVTIPQILNEAQTANAPYEMMLQNLNPNLQATGKNQTDFNSFQLQSDLAKELTKLQQPTGLQQWMPAIQGGLQGAGSAASKSAICLELLRRGLMNKEEYDSLHWKVLSSMFTRCRALLFYSRNGDKLVKAANEQGFNWQEAKSWFVDEPLSKETSKEAVDAYALSCKRLALIVAPELWDERVMKPNFLDFFVYIIPVMMVPGYRRCYKDLFSRTFRSLVEA